VAGDVPVVDDGIDCTVDECSETEKAVLHAPDAATCDDGNQCTLDTCDPAGGCSSMAMDGPCDDGNMCTVDGLCVNGECQEIEVDCNDESLCNGAETCDSATGDCLPGVAVDTDDGLDCTLDGCDDATGELSHVPQDGLCDDGDVCTLDVCDVDQGCIHNPADAACDDGNVCTDGDYCVLGECTPGEFICVEECSNETDDDQDLLVDCDDPDCSWEVACLGSGDTCGVPYPLNAGAPLAIGGEISFAATTEGKVDDVSGSCSVATGQSADTVHSLTLAEPLGLSVSLDFEGNAWSAFYILKDDCATQVFCAAASSTAALQTVTVLPAGTYFVVVDGAFAGDAAPYILDIATFPPAATEVGCGNKIDDDADGAIDCADIDCKTAAQCAVLSGDACEDAISLFGEPVSDNGQVWQTTFEGKTTNMGKDMTAGCDADTAASPDMVFALTLDDPMLLTAKHDFAGTVLYPAVYVRGQECSTGKDLACANALGGAASITLPLPAGVYFIVVDGAYAGDAGAFTLDVSLVGLPDQETECGNNVDDDLDGATDCEDLDCAASIACTGQPGDNCKMPFGVNDGKPIVKANGGDVWQYKGTTEGMNDDFTAPCDPDTGTNSDVVYKMILKDPMIVTLSHDFDGTLYPAMMLLDSSCGAEPIACVSGYSGAVTISMGLQPGTYFVEIDSAFPNEAGTYTFKVQVEAPALQEIDCGDQKDNDLDGALDCKDSDCSEETLCLDQYEPNNVFASAYDIGAVNELGYVTSPGTMVYPANDDDWYKFSVPGSCNVTITAVPEPGYDVELTLSDAGGKILKTADVGFGGDTESITVQVVNPSVFGASVHGFSGKTGDYMFSVTVNPAPETEWDCTNESDDDLDGKTDCQDEDCGGTAACGAGDVCATPLLVNGGKPIGGAMDGVQLNFQGTTVGYKDDLAGACSVDSDAAPDAVWKLVFDTEMDVSASLDFDGIKWPTLYVMTGTCPGAEIECIAGGEDAIGVDLTLGPGTYYFVVDGNWPNDASNYTFSLLFTLPPLTEFDCADQVDNDMDGAIDCLDSECAANAECTGETCLSWIPVNDGVPVTIADNGLKLDFNGDTTGMAGEYGGACSIGSSSAGDAVYSFILADKMDVAASLDFSAGSVPVVYLRASGCAVPDELDCAVGTDLPAELVATLDPGQYFVMVDANQPASGGAFTLSLTFMLPTKPPQCFPGDVVVTEIMKNPVQVSDSLGEWFELHNLTAGNIDLDGCIIKDQDTDFHTVVGSLVIPAGGYVVLGVSGDSAVNGGVTVDYQYTAFFLGNTADEVILVCSNQVIDSVVYSDPLFPSLAGASMQLDPSAYSDAGNDAAESWCSSTVAFGLGDKGTPGADNVQCKETLCGDQVDDDLDGLLDCVDPDCVADPGCPEALCDDTVDNDVDTLVDCDDPDCALSEYCADSDGDGVVDADDVCPGGNDLLDGDSDLQPDDCEVEWAGDAWPANTTEFDADLDVTVYLQVYMPGVTNAPGQGAGISVLLLYKENVGAVNQEMPMAFNVDKGDNDEYMATIPASFTQPGDSLTVDFVVSFTPPGLQGVEYAYNNGLILDQETNPAPLLYPITGTAQIVNPGDILITEVMQNPFALTDSIGEWFEVLNTTDHEIDVEGWALASANDAAPHYVSNGGNGVVVGPGEYFVFVRDVLALGEEAVPFYSYGGSLNLGNADDTVTIQSGDEIVDTVAWDNGLTFPDPNGASIQLAPTPEAMTAAGNDAGGAWCTSATAYATGDLGTPGAANPACL